MRNSPLARQLRQSLCTSRKGGRTHECLKVLEKEELRQEHNARGQSFRAPRREAHERNQNRAKAHVRKSLMGRVGGRKSIPAGVQKAGAKMATINSKQSYYHLAIIRRNCKVHHKCDKCVELRTHGGTAALPCTLAHRVENLSVRFSPTHRQHASFGKAYVPNAKATALTVV